MAPLRLSLAVPVLATTALAQSVSVQLEHGTAFDAQASAQSRWTAPAFTRAPNPFSVVLTDAVTDATGATRGWVFHSSRFTNDPSGVRYDLIEDSIVGRLGVTPAGPANTATTGPHELVLRLEAPHEVLEAWVVLTASSSTRIGTGGASSASALVQVDIGDDGSWEIDGSTGTGTWSASQLVPHREGRIAVRVRTGTSAAFAGGAHTGGDMQARVSLSVQVQPRAVSTIGPFNSACQAQLFTRLRPRLTGQIDVMTDIYLSNAPQLLIVGATTLNLPLPGGCALGVSPDILLPFASNPSGAPALVLFIPPGVPSGASLHAQSASLDAAGEIVTSGRSDVVYR